jgi:steroid delta-isomerase-like uncharacterized protein
VLTLPKDFNRRSFLNITGAVFGGAFMGLPASLSFPAHAAAPDGKIEKVIDELYAAYAALNAEKILALLTDDCFFEDPTFHLKASGKTEIRKISESLLQHYFNLKIELENRIVCRNWAITQQRFTGLSKVNASAEGKQISVRGASIFEFEKDKIKRWTDYYDFATFMKQMGAKSNP